MKDTLIAYYSRTGVTREVAQRLAVILDADAEEIRERKDRSGVLGYFGGGKDAMLKREAELTHSPSTEGRMTVILGMPVWAFGPPPAMLSYVRQANLAGKRVCAFCTMDGSGAERTFSILAPLIPGGLASTLGLLKPRSDLSALEGRLREWTAAIRGNTTGSKR